MTRLTHTLIFMELLFLITGSGYAQNVVFNDTNFKNALLANSSINTTDDGDISIAEAQAFTGTMDISNQSVADLTGLEEFINISGFHANGNSFSSVDLSNNTGVTSVQLSTCTNLTSINLGANTVITYLSFTFTKIASIDLSDYTSLESLTAPYNYQLTSIDLTGLTNLNSIIMIFGNLTSYDVTTNTALETLRLTSQKITSIDVSNNTLLRNLDMGNNNLTALDVSNNTELISLYIHLNDISALDLSANTALRTLSAYSNNLTDLDLSNNSSLTTVNVSDNNLSSLNVKNGSSTSISSFNATTNASLTCIKVDNPGYSTANWTDIPAGAEFKLSCDPNEVINFPDANFEAALIADDNIDTDFNDEITVGEAEAFAGTIDVNNQSISDLTGIEYFVNITELNVRQNDLVTFDISTLAALEVLNCSFQSSGLTSLDVTYNTALQELIASWNSLTSINVSNNTGLTYLDVGANNLTGISVSNLPDLEWFYAYDNNISSIDVTSNTQLTRLYVGQNNLTSLNVSNNTELLDFRANQNNISNIDISALTKATTIHLDNNNLTSIDVSNNQDVTVLNLHNNALGSIDLSNNPDLYETNLTGCGLSDVDVSNNPLLGVFRISSNSLTELNLSNNTALIEIQATNNDLTHLDISHISGLTKITVINNDLHFLNVANGNNTNFVWHYFTGNANLTCIMVDDVTYSNTNWSADKDAGASYNTDCGIYIPDANFKAALIADGYDTSEDGEIQVAEAVAVTGTIDVNGLSIGDLTGIEHFTDLTELIANNNNISSVNLSYNTLLENLNLMDNNISNIDLSNNTELSTLVLRGNNISTLDLSNNALLVTVNVMYNGMNSLELGTNNVIDYIVMDGNDFTEFDISGYPSMTKLAFSGNNSLTSLNAANGNNSNFTFFRGNSNPSLTCVVVDNPGYSKANWDLIDDPSLFKFTCNPNDIVNIPDVNFKAELLANASINTTDDGEITVGEAEAYTGAIVMFSKGISDATGIEYFSNVVTINFQSNSLSSIDVSNNTKITFMALSANNITSIDVTNNPLLTGLFLNNNQLTSVDVSNNTLLKDLLVQNNQLTALDVSNISGLERLLADNNDITSFDLSNNISIDEFKIHTNPNLASLDLRNGNNENIFNFDISNNGSLSCVTVDDPIWSKENWTNVDDVEIYKFSCDPNDIVNIPDTNFKTALLADAGVNTTDDGEITYGEAEAFTGLLDYQGENITDLTGFEAFINVSQVRFSGNSLGTVDLRYNTELTEFSCANCGLSSVDLSNNAKLTKITLVGNEITDIDLSNQSALVTLNMSNTPLNTIDLSNNTNLLLFWMSNSNITELDFSGLSSLKDIWFEDNLSLQSLNVANGVNSSFLRFKLLGNTNLTCVTVDDPSYSETNWKVASAAFDVDASVNFSTNCNNVANDITAFSFTEQASAATIGAGTIDIEVVLGTDLSSLTPTFTVSSGATADPASGVAQDFSSAFTYTVTAENPTAVQEWTVNVTEENVAPTDIALDNTSVDENSTTGVTVGALSSTDGNTDDTHTYSLVAGTGDADNALFDISGSNLLANEVFDFETKSSYAIRLMTDDGRGGTFEKAFTISINDLSGTTQTITFDALVDASIGDANFDLTATATSGLTVTFTSSDETVATVSGSTVTIVGAGTTTITASQVGNEDYAAATDIAQTLTVNKLEQAITFGAVADVAFGDVAFDLTATTNATGLSVSYTSSDETVATISGSTVTIVGAGSTIITASQAGDDTYNAATDVQQTLTVNKASQTITFDVLTDVTIGDAAFELTASATSELEVTYTSSDETVATISGSTVTILGAGTTTITASQAGDNNYEAAADVQQTLTVTAPAKSEQTITFAAIDDQFIEEGSLTLNATASSGLDVTYEILSGPATVSGNVVSFTDLGTITVSASQAGDNNFFAATPVEQSFEVITVTGFDQESAKISFYPNPVNDFLRIQGVNKIKAIELLDLTGKQVVLQQSNFSEVDMRELKQGNYVLRIHTSNEVITNQIIKR